ncbi:MAG: hypothetical protein KME11_03085 [Timaviella obliquedivisa GSE-PSE-MK23-08B]|jgi:hypothetical protein|nr:hypothetical protein [Timaviella obliquedivisa GSE-PSE-MK23-08B]MBW4514192.1 hypothetical protein [Timaviella obliquedivisa GSE-PSE-MK23-08B]
MPEFQLQDAANWEKVYDQSYQGSAITPTRYTPIPPFVISRLFPSHTLLIATDSSEALAHWRLGVRVQMIIDAPSTDFVQIDTNQISIPINRGLLVRFPKLSTLYRLRVEVPKWHRTMRVTIWEYSGTEASDTETLEFIREDLQRLEGKVNSLL